MRENSSVASSLTCDQFLIQTQRSVFPLTEYKNKVPQSPVEGLNGFLITTYPINVHFFFWKGYKVTTCVLSVRMLEVIDEHGVSSGAEGAKH